MQTIFVLEDDEDIRELVLYALKPQFSAEGFPRPADFWQAMKAGAPDLVLLDVMLPDEDGVSILKRLKNSSRTDNLPVIMLTAKAGEHDRVKGLDLGADDYITKPFSVLELVSRVKAVLRRSAAPPEAPKPVKIGSVALFPDKHAVTAEEKNVSLTHKEFELLQLLMENGGVVFSRERIMSRVWGVDFEGETRTVDMHVNTLRRKLGPGGGIVKTVRGVGYKVGK